MASAGFEWLVVDYEHTCMNLETVQNLISLIQGKSMKALVRVSKNEEVIIKKALDAGADGIIVPMIKNAEEAQQAVDFAYYPPIGKRGVGLYRAQGYGNNFHGYKDWLEKNVVVIAQIEHIEAVENIDSILSNERIDGVIIGPYDLSASMGMPGDYHKEDVKKAIKKIEVATKKHGKALGSHVIESEHEATVEKINLGYSFLAFSLDFLFLGNKVRAEMHALKEKVNL